LLLGGLPSQGVAAQLDDTCVVSVLNRTVTVQPNGSWVLPNIPANIGRVRARATCVKDGVTTSGQSDFFLVPANGVVSPIPPIAFDAPAPIPSEVTCSAPVTTLRGAGATVQLSVLATYAGGQTGDITSQASGTNYTSSNPRIASVGPDGLVTAQGSGVVLITALNDGATGFLRLTVALSNDSDGDGIPDDYEIAHGMNPNDPTDALEDFDHDGLTNLQEYQLGTDPRNADTDGDGLPDGLEVKLGTNPLAYDSDGGGIGDGLEIQAGTNPLDPSDDLTALARSLSSIEVQPAAAVIYMNTLVGEGSVQLKVVGHLTDGHTIDLTSRTMGTAYSSSDVTTVSFGGVDGQIFGGQNGSAAVTVTNSGFSATVPVTVSAFSPTALSYLELPGYANAVDIAGNYAYIADGIAGLQLVDVRDRRSPVIVAGVSLPGNADDVKVVGGIAYVAADSAGLQAVDVSNPASPAVIGSVAIPGGAQDIVVRGAWAYVGGPSGLTVVDVRDPRTLLVVASYATPGVVRGVDVQGDKAVLAGAVLTGAASGLLTLDVTDPTTPTALGSLPTVNAQAVLIDGAWLYLADYTGSLAVIDISSPAAPVVRARESGPLGGYLLNLAKQGQFLFGADVFFVNGVPISNVADPNDPKVAARLDFTARDDNGTGIAVDSQYVYLVTAHSTASRTGTTSDGSRLYIGQYLQFVDTAGVPPQVRLTAPLDGSDAPAGTPILLHADASDDFGVASVTFTVGGVPTFTALAPPYEFIYKIPADVSSLTFGATAVDFGGNAASAVPVTISVHPDAPPVISLTDPSAGSTLTDQTTVTLAATASDDGRVTRVVFAVNGTAVGTSFVPPFQTSYAIPRGVTSLQVVARAIDDGNLSADAAATFPVRRYQPPPIQGPISVSYYGKIVDRVSPTALTPDTNPDAVFAVNLDAGANVTRYISSIEVAGPLTRSTQPSAGSPLGVVSDPRAPFLNSADGSVDLAVSGPVSLLLVAADLGFIQPGAAYTVTVLTQDGSRFQGTLASQALASDEAVSAPVSVANTIAPERPASESAEAASTVISVMNATLPPANGGEASEATSAVVSIKSSALPEVATGEAHEAVSAEVSIKNAAAPSLAAGESGEASSAVVSIANASSPGVPADEAKEAVSAALSIKNLNGMLPPGVLQFSAANYVVNENAGTIAITVLRTGGADGTIAVDYSTTDGSARAGSDYMPSSGTLVFGAGETTSTFTVSIVDNSQPEPSRIVQLRLANPQGGGSLGSPNTATITIRDVDQVPVLTVDDVSVLEGDVGTTPAVFAVHLSSPSRQPVAVDFATSPMSATAPSDYLETAGTLSIPAGATEASIPVLVNGDFFYEPDELFALRLSNIQGATLGTSQAVGTILNDDPPPHCASRPSGMVAWWPLDSNPTDIVGGSDGVLQGDTAFGSGHVREALALDGVDDAMVASDGRLPLGAAARTIELWIKPVADGVPVIYGAAAANDAFYVRVIAHHACLGQWGGTGTCGTTDVTDGEWHHVAATYDGGSDARLYVDGHLEASASQSYATTATGRLIVGSTPDMSGDYYQGSVDEVSVYNRALAASEIELLVRADNFGKCCACTSVPSGLVSSWSGEGNANDRLGTNNGVVNGALGFASGQVGQAFQFAGTPAYVEVPASGSLGPNGQFTVEFWAYPLPQTGTGLLNESDSQVDGAGWAFSYDGSPGGQRSSFGVQSSASDLQTLNAAPGTVPVGQWTHIAGTSDGTTMHLYINGVEVSSSPSPAVLPSPFSLLVGASQRNGIKEQFFNGKIDEVNVYNRALGADEIRGIVNAARAGLCRAQ
jgi:hypothetical protein